MDILISEKYVIRQEGKAKFGGVRFDPGESNAVAFANDFSELPGGLEDGDEGRLMEREQETRTRKKGRVLEGKGPREKDTYRCRSRSSNPHPDSAWTPWPIAR
jgi:hypothetical protein